MQPNADLSARFSAAAGMARIVDHIDETWLLDTMDGPARRAASCHLRPGVGDRVWFVRQGGACFITAVLERAEPRAPSTLDLGTDVTLQGTNVAIEAKDTLRVRASSATAAIGRISTFAKAAVHHVAKTTVVGSVLEHVVDHFTAHTKTSQRTVEQLDQLQARDVDHRADGTLALAGKHTLLRGRALIKADGDQIHLG